MRCPSISIFLSLLPVVVPGEATGLQAPEPNDLVDAKNRAIRRRTSQAGRVAIVGNSYGGSATLAAPSMRPKEFACGVDSFGPANLKTSLATLLPHRLSEHTHLIGVIGDPAAALKP